MGVGPSVRRSVWVAVERSQQTKGPFFSREDRATPFLNVPSCAEDAVRRSPRW
ncbi:hypothetical protein NG791_25645 [Laspinema sp. D1]|uniref:hypothetical protein n=1 Tax=Laspinema palackyanum TaxID=3231601 RepID=UPI0034732B72|nr:hypothetical protein [Laspinema sp. D2b]